MYLEFIQVFQERTGNNSHRPREIQFRYVGETPAEKEWDSHFNNPLHMLSSALSLYHCCENAKYLTEILISDGSFYIDYKYYDVDLSITGACIIHCNAFKNYANYELSSFMVNDILKGWLVSYNLPQGSPPLQINVEWSPDEVIVYNDEE